MDSVLTRVNEQRTKNVNYSRYERVVTIPAKRSYRIVLAACSGLTGAAAILRLLYLQEETFIWFFYSMMLAFFVALFLSGAAYLFIFFKLHFNYIDTSNNLTETKQEEYGVVPERDTGREVPLQNSRTAGTVVMTRPDKDLGGITFSGAHLIKMAELLDKGNEKMVRDQIGMSGSAFPERRQALAEAGFLDLQTMIYTDAGKAWIREV